VLTKRDAINERARSATSPSLHKKESQHGSDTQDEEFHFNKCLPETTAKNLSAGAHLPFLDVVGACEDDGSASESFLFFELGDEVAESVSVGYAHREVMVFQKLRQLRIENSAKDNHLKEAVLFCWPLYDFADLLNFILSWSQYYTVVALALARHKHFFSRTVSGCNFRQCIVVC